MVSIRQALILTLLLPLTLGARKFYNDDPLEKMPPPLSVEKITPRELSGYYEFFAQTFGKPGEHQPKKDGEKFKPIRAAAVNTLGEVPDSAWFTNRIGARPTSTQELVAGPRNGAGPSVEGPWTIVAAKTQGVTPGFTILDADGRKYVLKFDPLTNPEMTTTADFLGSLFFHALGYNVPENYIVKFDRTILTIGEGTMVRDLGLTERPMSQSDIDMVLAKVPRDSQARVQGIASRFLPGKPVGGFLYHGTRPDDPNDIVQHEHRRDLRGLFVFAAWLGHDDARALNTLDMLLEENGVSYVKHHLIDFGSILGSASVYANSPRSGNEHLFEWTPAAFQVFTLGLLVPKWARHDYRYFPSVGRFDYRIFEPEKWKPDEANSAFRNRLPDDDYWAAKKVMAFQDDQIRAIVQAGGYTDREASDWVAKCLIERRAVIGRTYFAKVVPLENFRIDGGQLAFEDLEIKYGFKDKRDYTAEWFLFDNDSEKHTPISGAAALTLPTQAGAVKDGEYFGAVITAEDPAKRVRIYFRRTANSYQLVGIERTWPGVDFED